METVTKADAVVSPPDETKHRRSVPFCLTDDDYDRRYSTGDHAKEKRRHSMPLTLTSDDYNRRFSTINAGHDHNAVVNPSTNNGGKKTLLMADQASSSTSHDTLPVGYRFVPTDEELIKYYLWNKILKNHQRRSRSPIHHANVYGYHPMHLTAEYRQATEGVWYFFASRNRISDIDRRPSRGAGDGYWKASGKGIVIIDGNGVIIGRKQALTYLEGQQPNGVKTCWLMHEYIVEEGSDDKKFDDYVLCKIYKNGRMKDEAVSDQLQQPRVTSNDQDENLTNDIDMDQNKQDDVVTQYMTNQSMDLTALDHVNIHLDLPALDSNQHMSPNIGKLMVHEQLAHVVSNQDMNPHHGESYSRAKTVAKEAKGQVMVRDQQACVVSSQDINPSVLQVENNVVVQNNQDSESLYDLIMKACTTYTESVDTTSFQPNRAPLVHHSCPTRLDNKYTLQNPPTRQRSQSLPPLHRHGHPWMYMYDPSFNPPAPQGTQPAFQDNNECDGRVIFERNIKLMIMKDGYDGLSFDNNYRFQFDRPDQLDTDESKKHA